MVAYAPQVGSSNLSGRLRHNRRVLPQYVVVRGRTRTDEELLREPASDPEGFGVFYRRHERVVLGLFVRATGRAPLSLDLTAETLARARVASRVRSQPGRGARLAVRHRQTRLGGKPRARACGGQRAFSRRDGGAHARRAA